MNSLRKRIYYYANQLATALAFEHQSAGRKFLRTVLCVSPMFRAVLLYQAGMISAAKDITDRRHYKNQTMQRIVARIRSISLALTDWSQFVEQLNMPAPAHFSANFNGHVVMVVNSCSGFDNNGYAVRSAQLGLALNNNGVTVRFLARLGYPWDMQGRDDWEKVAEVASNEGEVTLEYDPDWLVGGPDPEYWRQYANYIKKIVLKQTIRPSVLHAHSKYSNAIASVMAGREMGLPVVYEMRGLWHLTRAQREPAFSSSDFFKYEERLEIWAAELADRVVVLSESMQDWLIDKGVGKNKIQVIPNAVELVDWENFELEPSFSTSCIKLGFIGSLTPYEGVDTVLEALNILLSEGHKASLDVFGDGRFKKQLQDLSRDLGLTESVTFHGRVEKTVIKRLIQNFDFFPVVRKQSELTRLIPPLKQLDPMLNARIVLISSLPALLKNVPPCIAALAIPPDDPAALAAILEKLVSQPQELVSIGLESRDWVINNRNWSDNAQRYHSIYVGLCGDQ